MLKLDQCGHRNQLNKNGIPSIDSHIMFSVYFSSRYINGIKILLEIDVRLPEQVRYDLVVRASKF